MIHDPTLKSASDPTLSNHLFDDALRAVRKHLNMPISYLSKFEGDQIRFLNVSSDLTDPFLVSGATCPAEGTYCKAVKDGLLPELLPDTSKNAYARSLPITSSAPIGAVVSIPIVLGNGKVYGMFCCLSHRANPDLTDRDHEVMSAFARLVTDIVQDRHKVETAQDMMRDRINAVIEAQDFDVVLQPIVDLHTRETRSVESLCRFRGQPYRSPDMWFADAQSCGLGEKLELTVFRAAAAQMRLVPQDVSVSINLSPNVVLSDGLMALLGDVDTARLVIEVTEHATFKDNAALCRRIADLRATGARVALDDLGTGYSSLSAVLNLRPDIVKLDRKLISHIHCDPASRSLTSAIVKFTQDIDACLVAEGIETPDQVTALINLGVVSGQGYLFARPDRVENLQFGKNAA